MLSQQRQKLIVDHLRTHKSAQVNTLSDIFGISLSTVRRDLSKLEETGVLRRVHGGVMLLENQQESPILQRGGARAEEKTRIGAAAASLVLDSDTIIITGGTTTEMMIPFLGDKENLTVVTNALNIAWKLAQYSHINVIVLGGWLRHSEYSLLGHLTEQALRDIHASKVFHGTYGLDVNVGLVGSYIQEVQTDRRVIDAAGELIVLADSSKFGRPGTVRITSLENMSTLVTDQGAPEEDVAALEKKGIRVLIA